MPILSGTFYHNDPFNPGTVSTIDVATVNSEEASADIQFGTAVAMKDGKVITATSAPIYGVAIRRPYVNADKFYPDAVKADKWNNGETISVLREGTIAVVLSADVKKGESATVDANGKFKTATSTDKVVGVFMDNGNKDSTASLQVRISLDNPTPTK